MCACLGGCPGFIWDCADARLNPPSRCVFLDELWRENDVIEGVCVI